MFGVYMFSWEGDLQATWLSSS